MVSIFSCGAPISICGLRMNNSRATGWALVANDTDVKKIFTQVQANIRTAVAETADNFKQGNGKNA